MANMPEKKIKLLEQIQYNMLDKAKVKNSELAKEIARKWIKA